MNLKINALLAVGTLVSLVFQFSLSTTLAFLLLGYITFLTPVDSGMVSNELIRKFIRDSFVDYHWRTIIVTAGLFGIAGVIAMLVGAVGLLFLVLSISLICQIAKQYGIDMLSISQQGLTSLQLELQGALESLKYKNS